MNHKRIPSVLSYQTRLQRYLQEKQQLIRKNPTLPPAELDNKIKKLANKWHI